jgi:hypothetical protein
MFFCRRAKSDSCPRQFTRSPLLESRSRSLISSSRRQLDTIETIVVVFICQSKIMSIITTSLALDLSALILSFPTVKNPGRPIQTTSPLAAFWTQTSVNERRAAGRGTAACPRGTLPPGAARTSRESVIDSKVFAASNDRSPPCPLGILRTKDRSFDRHKARQ